MTDLYLAGSLAFVVAAATSWLLTPLVIRAARAFNVLDRPDGRKMHREPVPRVGGVAVFAGFVTGLAVAAQFAGVLFKFPVVTVYWSVLAAAATIMFLLGLLDDVRGLGFGVKFVVQIAAAVAVWSGGFRVEILSWPFGGVVDLGIWSLPVTVVWIVGITNALNLIDGLDGLAAGTALITTVAVAVLAISRDQMGVAAAAVALVGSLVGFLRFNFNPARIFLGDSGSMFLGFVLSVISIRGSQKGSTAVAVLAPLLALGLPLVDTGFAIVRRSWRIGREGFSGRHGFRFVARNLHRLFLPDRGHVHHQLIDRGFSHRGAVLVLYVAAGALALAALVTVVWNAVWVAGLLLAALAGAVVFVSLVYRVPSGTKEGPPPPGARGVPLGRTRPGEGS